MKFEELTVCVCPFTNCVKNIEHFVKLSKKKMRWKNRKSPKNESWFRCQNSEIIYMWEISKLFSSKKIAKKFQTMNKIQYNFIGFMKSVEKFMQNFWMVVILSGKCVWLVTTDRIYRKKHNNRTIRNQHLQTKVSTSFLTFSTV